MTYWHLHVEIDWAETGWGSATDAENDLFQATCSRGFSGAAADGFVASPGQATVTLYNRDGAYSRHNTASPFYGNIRGKKPIRLRLAIPTLAYSKVIWAGRIDKIRAGAQVGDSPTAVLTCSGPFSRLTDGRQVTPTASPGDTTDALLESLFTAAGFTSGEWSFDTGEITTGVWSPIKVEPLSEAKLVVGTELGRLYEAKDGVAHFESRHYRRDTTRSNTSQLTLSDDPGDGPTYRYRAIDVADPEENIYDHVTVSFRPHFTIDDDPVQIFYLGNNSGWIVNRGSSRTFTINPFSYPFVFASTIDPAASQSGVYEVVEWVDPTVSGGDPDIVALGSPYAAQSALSISNITTTPQSITFTLSNSDPDLDLPVSIIRLMGRRGVTGALVEQEVGSGIRDYPLPGPYYPTGPVANTAARWLYDYYSEPRDILTLTIPAVRSATLLQAIANREISDRFTVTATGSRTELALDEDFFLEGERWDFTRDKQVSYSPTLSGCLPNTHDSESDDGGLPTGMRPYYGHEEASGLIRDATTESLDLTRVGPTPTIGIVGKGSAFAGASNQYLVYPSHSLLDTDYANAHEWIGWIKPGSAWSPDQIIFQKDLGENFAYRIYIYTISGNHYVAASITTSGGTFTTLGIPGNSISPLGYNFVRFQHDPILKTIGISMTPFGATALSPFVTETYTGTPSLFTDGFVFGGTATSTGSGTPPAADSSTTYTHTASISPATSYTVSFTNTAGNFLLVGLTFSRGPSANFLSSITYDGIPLTFLTYDFDHSALNEAFTGTNTHWHAVAYLVAPSTGTHDLVMTWTGTTVSRITLGVRSFSGVDPSTPFSASTVAQGNSTAVSTTVASATDELVVDVVGTGMGVLSTRAITGHGAGQTQQYNLQDNNSANGTNGAGSYKTGAASSTLTWTIDSSIGWVSAALSLTGTGASLLPLNSDLDEWGYKPNGILSTPEAETMWNSGSGTTAVGDDGNIFVPVGPSSPPTPIPSGPTSGRPGAPTSGQLYFDTDLGQLIYWDGDSWEPAADAIGANIPKSIGTAKGDLIAFTGSAVPVRVGVGSNSKVLMADSTAAAGVSWQTTAATRTFDLLTNGVPSAPELVFDTEGNVIWTEV